MQLFNTLSQRKEALRPLGDEVTMYMCGITPYDTTHLGHAFCNVVYDTVARYLRWRGQPVNYVQNVTDIDDDILRKAREVGTTWDELGRSETAKYLDDLAAINVAPPTHYVRATETIETMVELIGWLVDQGHAYAREGWVYFSVASDPGFGALADAAGYVGYETLLATANERGNNPDDPRKEDPLDFVLWQARQEGEPSWGSPWGAGRPGWHIECSSMAYKYLGPRIDIHGGGADLIFPHHTCEIAQSENATGEHPFVQVWMHCAMVYMDGEKMSKSLGNLVRVGDLLKTYSPDAIRVLLLRHHYRAQWEWAPEEMEASAALAARLRAVAAGGAGAASAAEMEADAVAGAACEDFVAALEDDLDTPQALEVLERLAGAAESGAGAQAAMLRELGGVLGLRLGA